MMVFRFFKKIHTLGLTESEIGTLPEETRVYESVGRMFILSDKQTVAGRLTDKQSSCQEKVTYFILAQFLVRRGNISVWGQSFITIFLLIPDQNFGVKQRIS